MTVATLPAPTEIIATGAGGLTVRFGDRKAFCHTGMPAEEFAAAKAACDVLLREMVEAVMRDEIRAARQDPRP
jgi:hypothetical protein